MSITADTLVANIRQALPIEGLQLHEVDLSQRDFAGAVFVGVHFESVDAAGADFQAARFEECTFFDCNMRGAIFDACTFKQCQFRESRLQDVSMIRMRMESTEWLNANCRVAR